MKQLTRHYQPKDTRGPREHGDSPPKLRDGGMADEFEALFTMRDETTPELKGDIERGAEPTTTTIDKSNDRGFER